MNTKIIGYWAVGTSPWNDKKHDVGSIFVSLESYQAGVSQFYKERGYKLIPSYIEESDAA